jgi:ribosomal protein S18 acetylase RimI-like enzyme
MGISLLGAGHAKPAAAPRQTTLLAADTASRGRQALHKIKTPAYDRPMHVRQRDGRELPVRRLTTGDAAALARFNDDLSDASRRLFLPHRYDGATLAKILARAEAGDDLTLGVFDAERIAGYFFLWYFRQRVPLLGIGLLDAYHGPGLGRQILTLLHGEARPAGRDGVELTTMPDNARAFALYQSVGFRYLRDVENIQGEGETVIERAMFYEIKPGARPMDGPHRPPV